MAKFSGSEDIFRELVEDSKNNWLYGLVSFAIVEEQRMEWMKHHLETTGTPATQADITGWYQSQPQGTLLRAQGMAEDALQNYSQEVIEQFEKDFRKEIECGIIVSEIKEGRKVRPQLFINIIGGLLGSMIFAAFLIVMAFIMFNDTSTTEIGTKLKSSLELPHGKQ